MIFLSPLFISGITPEHNSSLTTLNLSSNSIGDSGVSALATALQYNSSLTTLNLTGNSIGDSGASALATALSHNSSLTTLNLTRNSIGDSGASALATALSHNSSLITLRMQFPSQFESQVKVLLERNKVDGVKKLCSLFELLLPVLSICSTTHFQVEQANLFDWDATSWTDSSIGQTEESLETDLSQSLGLEDGCWEQPNFWEQPNDWGQHSDWDAEKPFDS